MNAQQNFIKMIDTIQSLSPIAGMLKNIIENGKHQSWDSLWKHWSVFRGGKKLTNDQAEELLAGLGELENLGVFDPNNQTSVSYQRIHADRLLLFTKGLDTQLLFPADWDEAIMNKLQSIKDTVKTFKKENR